MKVMEAIGKGFGIAGKNLGILTILFVFNAVWNLATLPFLGQAPDLANLKVTPNIIILSIIFIFLNIFMQGGILGTIKDAVASDGKAVLGNFAKYGAKFYSRFLGLGLAIILLIILAALVVGLVFSISLVIKNLIANIVSVSVAIILGVIALYYLFLLFLSPYVLIADDVGVFKAMANSMKFVKSHIGKIIGLSTLLVLIGLGIGFIVGILAGIIALAVKGTAFQILTGIISSGVNAYVTVIISAGLMAYYVALSGSAQKKEVEISA